jgi:prevent-host-death family protein
MTAKKITASEFNRHLGAVIDQVRNGKEAVYVCNHGRPQVVMVPVDEYEALLSASRELAWMRLARLSTEGTTTTEG